MLGVHEATVRRWTRLGYLQAFRTPGGHRRYLRSSLEEFMATGRLHRASGPPALQRLRQVTLLAARPALQARLAAEPWRPRYQARERALRTSGRQLLGWLLRYAADPARGEGCLQLACQRLRRYGAEAAQLGLSAADTARAFVVFRRTLVEAVARSLLSGGHGGQERWEMVQRAEHFFDELLVAMLQGYGQGYGTGSGAAAPGLATAGASGGGWL